MNSKPEGKEYGVSPKIAIIEAIKMQTQKVSWTVLSQFWKLL